MACIEPRKRADGTTAYRVVWYAGGRTPSGRPEKESAGTFDDRVEAEKFKAVFEAANNVADALAAYHLTPIIGSLPGDTIERDRIRAWVNEVSTPDPVRAGTALAQARKERDLSRDHLATRLGWETKKVAGYETGGAPLEEEDLAAVFTALGLPRVQRQLITTVAYGMGAKTPRNVHSCCRRHSPGPSSNTSCAATTRLRTSSCRCTPRPK